MLHHDSRVTWTDPSCPCHLIETVPTERALQPQGLPLKILVSINVATCPHGTTHVAKKVDPWSRTLCTSAPGAGGDATIEEDSWRGTRASMLQCKRCNKRSVPSIFSKNSPSSVSFLLQQLEKAEGQLWVHIHDVPICFLGLSYKWLHSLKGLWKLYTMSVSIRGFFLFFTIFHLEIDRHFQAF